MYLIDTNVLLRFLTPTDPYYSAIRQALMAIRAKGENLCTAPQNIAEFRNVCTRSSSSRGGYGLSSAETARRLKVIERFIMVLSEQKTIYDEWKRIVLAHSVAGVQVYDARIVTTMIIYGVQSIVTFNVRDFARYPGINAIHPNDVR
jgi:predicted nucleic acid-binding protein